VRQLLVVLVRHVILFLPSKDGLAVSVSRQSKIKRFKNVSISPEIECLNEE